MTAPTEAQLAGLTAVFNESLSDLVGQPCTQDTRDIIMRRVLARIAVVDELIEHEAETP